MNTNTHEHMVLSADGTEIGINTVGSGPPLVLVHGAWNWAEHWMGVAEDSPLPTPAR